MPLPAGTARALRLILRCRPIFANSWWRCAIRICRRWGRLRGSPKP